MVDVSGKKMGFIIGIERSGTSLLNKVLNNHPAVHCMPEASFFVFSLYKYRNHTAFSEYDVKLILKQVRYYYITNPWVGWDFNVDEVEQELLAIVKQRQISYVELCKIIYSRFKVVGVDKSQAEWFIDKNPSYTIQIDEIKKAIPDSKFLYLVRDYRGNVLSKKQVADLKMENVAFNAVRWKLLNKLALKFYKKHKEDTLLIRYEDFVSDTAEHVKKLTHFLNISGDFDWQNDKVKFDTDHSKYAKTQLSEFEKKKFEKKYTALNKTINTERTEAWKTELTEEEIKICDAICYPFAKNFGIAPHFQLNAMDRFQIKAKNLLSITKAYVDVIKDIILYYVSPAIKLKRIEQIYRKSGILNDKDLS